jgi:quinol monooxygenase YgiN
MILSFPWRNALKVERDKTYVALLGLVRLESIRILPAFVGRAIKIERQLRRTAGVIGYRTATAPHSLSFYHLSAWTDAEAIQTFVGTAPHQTSMQELDGRLGETVFRYWSVAGASLPLRLHDELHRITGNQSS